MRIVEDYRENYSRLIAIKSADFIGDFKIQITFNDGVDKLVDFKPFLETAVHPSITKYLDPDKFIQFTIIDGNLNWNDYDMIFPVNDLYKGSL